MKTWKTFKNEKPPVGIKVLSWDGEFNFDILERFENENPSYGYENHEYYLEDHTTEEPEEGALWIELPNDPKQNEPY